LATIGIDYTPAHEQGAGIGRLVREMILALSQEETEHDFKLFVSGAKNTELTPIFPPHFQWKSTRITPDWLARIWQRLLLPLPIETFVGDVDLYHATDFVLPPTRSRTKTIVTVHDLSFVRTPETASPRLKVYLDKVVPRSIHRADHVIADSSATKADLMSIYGLTAEKISVVLSGVNSRFTPVEQPDYVRAKYNIPEKPFVLAVGTVQPRKNFARLIEAVHAVREEGLDIDLVIAGGKGWLADAMYDTINRLNVGDYVHLIGFVEDADLPALYSAADVFAFPSLYEGFGLPVLEAMACGTPVITSNVSSLPEVAGDAAICVNPYDVTALQRAIRIMFDDDVLCKNLIEKGFEQAKRFSWQQSAKDLLAVYSKVLNL